MNVAIAAVTNVVTLTSNRYGTASNVSVTGGTGRTNLGFSSATTSVGADVAGLINGVAATGSGQYLTGATGNLAEGLKIQISGGVTGNRGTVNYSRGYAYQLDKLTDTFLGSNGPISSRTDGIDRSVKDIGNRREVINRRLVDVEKRYRAQFTALDSLLSSLSTTSNFLTQQLAAISTSKR